MLQDAFLPSNAGTVTISVTNASVFTSLPANGEFLELQNFGTNDVFIESTTKTNGQAATVAASYPVRAGQCKIIRRKQGDDGIACIAAVSGSLYVSAGVGT